VVDGDTVELNLKSNGEYERVRLISVDTPEVYGEVECYGPEASSFTHSALDYEDALCLTYDPAITAESDNIDPYGRTLAYLFYGPDFSHFLNAELLSGGYAEAAFYTDNTEFEGYFRTLEDWAQGYELGMWGACY
jgi:micrococcal nuclease